MIIILIIIIKMYAMVDYDQVIKFSVFLKRCFHLVGVIFTSGVKFTLLMIKWNERHFVLWQVCIFLGGGGGNSDATIYFWVEQQFSPKMKNLESWWLIAIFSNPEGWSGLGGCHGGQVGRWVGGLRGGLGFWWPALAASPKTRATLRDC